ncbi:MAG TPA: glutamate dehydrogenase, partial [Candidatus Marinimicrobia bacterium]|nr:glutamate dehydrogenase [Candidatus Neomarinimicrobiota bacterium]
MKYKTKKEFLNSVVDNYKDQKEFHQAVEEVVHSIWDTANENPEYGRFNILDRIVVPDRTIIFRVPWMDDKNEVHV